MHVMTVLVARSQNLLGPILRSPSRLISRRIIIPTAANSLQVATRHSLSLRTMSSAVTTHPSLTTVTTESTHFLRAFTLSC